MTHMYGQTGLREASYGCRLSAHADSDWTLRARTRARFAAFRLSRMHVAAVGVGKLPLSAACIECDRTVPVAFCVCRMEEGLPAAETLWLDVDR